MTTSEGSSAQAVPPAQPPLRPSLRRRLLRVARPLVALLVVAALVWTVVDQWRPLQDEFAQLSVLYLVLAAVGALVSVAGQMLCWRELLTDLGSRLPLGQAGRVFFLGQLGKYLPGSVWPVVAQMELARDLKVPRARTATTVLLFMLVNLVSAAAVAGVLLPLTVGDTAADDRWAWVGRWPPVFLLLVLPVVVLHPQVLNRLTALGLRLMRRPAADTVLTIRGVVQAVGWAVLEWVAAGVMLAALLAGFGDAVSLPLAVGAFALAWAAGFLVVVVPAGAGVREGVLVVLLSGSVGQPTALAAALATRLLMTLADGFWALLLFPHGFRGRRSSASGRTDRADPLSPSSSPDPEVTVP